MNKVMFANECNIVLEKTLAGLWQLRQQSMKMKQINNEELQTIGRTLVLFKIESILFHNIKSVGAVISFVRKISEVNYCRELKISPEYKSFELKVNYKNEKNYIKTLLIAGYGDVNGNQLTYPFPHDGLESIAYRANRFTHSDVRVYNPNVTSINDLVSFVEIEQPEIICFAVLETTFQKVVEIFGEIYRLLPETLYFFGGPTMPGAPHRAILDSFPVFGIFIDEGEALLKLLSLNKTDREALTNNIRPSNSIDGLLTNHNINHFDRKKIKKFRSNIPTKYLSDIPKGVFDITHGKISYPKTSQIHYPVPRGKLGKNPLFINEDLLGNGCKGRCIFCSLTLNSTKPKNPQYIFDYIKNEIYSGNYDAIYFGAPDIFNDEIFLQNLAELLKKDDRIRAIPKRGTARVDYTDTNTLISLKLAGFVAISYGIETFDTPSLRAMGKTTTREKNIKALEETISLGMYPIIYGISFNRMSTVQTVFEDLRLFIYFAEKGKAAFEMAFFLRVYWDTPSEKLKAAHQDPLEIDYEWMKKPFHLARHVKYKDLRLREVRERAIQLQAEKRKSKKWPIWANNSFTFHDFLMMDSLLQTFQELDIEDIAHEEIDLLRFKLDNLIHELIIEESQSILPQESTEL